MENTLVNILPREIRIPGLERSYRIFHVTDAHLLLYDAQETAERAEYAAPRVAAFAAGGITTTRRFEALMEYARAHKDELDLVIFTGDILDFPSKSNIAFLGKALENLPVPYFFVLGNHDWSYFNDYHTPRSQVAERPLFSKWSGGNTFVHKMQLGELTLVGVDDTMELYEDGVAEALAEALTGEENVLLLQHIPLDVPTLRDDTTAYWHRNICVGGEGICKNENWKAVRQLVLAQTSPVKAMITGHLHFHHEDVLENGITQYVTANAADGSAAIYDIHG